MATEQNNVVAVFDTATQARNAFGELIRKGFTPDQVRITPDDDTQAAREAALASLAARDHATGGKEDEGWSIGSFFHNLFGGRDEDSVQGIYSEALRRGNTLVTVHASDESLRDTAADVLNAFDPIDIDECASDWQSQGWSGMQTGAGSAAAAQLHAGTGQRQGGQQQSGAAATRTQQQTGSTQATAQQQQAGMQSAQSGAAQRTAIPVIEEALKIGKRAVQKGGVRIFQPVSEKPVSEQVQLREERVVVERHPVDQPFNPDMAQAFKEGSMEVRETAEEVVVEKSARVVEEVVVGKQVQERTETVSDTVRRTDVEVEQLAAQTGTQSGAQTGMPPPSQRGMQTGTTDWRSHWQSNYAKAGGKYEEYEPAYQFGQTLRKDARFKDKTWADVEANARKDWERGHAGSAWERFKEAVRHGWEKVT